MVWHENLFFCFQVSPPGHGEKRDSRTLTAPNQALNAWFVLQPHVFCTALMAFVTQLSVSEHLNLVVLISFGHPLGSIFSLEKG